eukprot:TRINITY_DN52966_c0_g1_i1.p1 TRINITY_DN52966_c0_g1~~TRINITY_DN52966_c0_g1_i1.p1  ORF type:complete len:298 (-),score=49.79 TRINITY_DN52966_c0_g1_i1:38-931(-)
MDSCEVTLEVAGNMDVEVDVAESSVNLGWASGEQLRLPVNFLTDVADCQVKRSRRRGILTLRLPKLAERPLPSIALAHALRERDGLGTIDGFMCGPMLERLREHLLQLWKSGTYQPGEVEGTAEWATAARTDFYRYIDEKDEIVKTFTRRLDRLLFNVMQEVPELNSVKLVRGSPMAAVYAGHGSRYTPHFDSRDKEIGRVITCILYLNPFWTAQDGGQLRIWPQASSLTPSGPCREIEPLHGKLVAFLCHRRNLHEVCQVSEAAGTEPRLAISCWYYDSESMTSKNAPRDARAAPA